MAAVCKPHKIFEDYALLEKVTLIVTICKLPSKLARLVHVRFFKVGFNCLPLVIQSVYI